MLELETNFQVAVSEVPAPRLHMNFPDLPTTNPKEQTLLPYGLCTYPRASPNVTFMCPFYLQPVSILSKQCITSFFPKLIKKSPLSPRTADTHLAAAGGLDCSPGLVLSLATVWQIKPFFSEKLLAIKVIVKHCIYIFKKLKQAK